MILRNQKTFHHNSLIFLSFTLAFAVCYIYFSDRTNDADYARFQQEIYKIESDLISTEKEISAKQQIPSFEEICSIGRSDQQIFLYHSDTLIRWNDNTHKISNLLEKGADGISIQKTTNGWYLNLIKNKGKFSYRISTKIFDEYPLENAYLSNGFTDHSFRHINASLIFDDEIGYPIYDSAEKYLFSIQSNGGNSISQAQQYLVTGLLFLTLITFIRLIFQLIAPMRSRNQIIIWSALLFLRYLSLKYNWLSSFGSYELFQAHLFAVDFFSPNLFEFIISMILFLCTGNIFLKSSLLKLKSTQATSIVQGTLSLLIWGTIAYYITGFVFHSTIQLATIDLFKLNAYSILAILIIGGCCLFYYQIIEHIHRRKLDRKTTYLHLGIFLVWSFISLFVLKFHWSLTLYPVVLFVLVHLFEINNRIHSAISYLVYGLATSVMIAVAIQHLNIEKELENRPFFASQLFNEKDFNTEIAYHAIDSLLQNDRTIQYYLRESDEYNANILEEYLEKKYFHQLSNQYDIGYYLFDSSSVNISNQLEGSNQLFEDFNTVVEYHGERSEINPNIVFINDYIAQFSYIIQRPIYINEQLFGTLICTMKSKKIPETIGFPKLLIAEPVDSKAMISHYSFARYHEGQLINEYGAFDYPYAVKNIAVQASDSLYPFNWDGFNHSIYSNAGDDQVIVSVKLNTFFELTTSVSFFFIFFLLLMVFVKMPILWMEIKRFKWNRLASKIQIAIIALIVLTITITTWGSGEFFRKQFHEITDQQIITKTTAVEQDLRTLLGRLSALPSHQDYSLMKLQLRRLSKIHQTDINIYNAKGHLIATSRQQIYNYGLLSEQINPIAHTAIFQETNNRFIHEENIGNLNYASSYSPIQNFSGDVIGTLNLQFFGQQESIEGQMNVLFATLINIFILVFVVAIILTVIIGTWITSPLRQLHTNLSTLKFGKNSSRLTYDKKDEIGDLVEDYNSKLEELEEAGQQLAKSERESAWRDMAKQVAHEIKNPLTPMKLSVQHLQRSMSLNPDDPNLQEKVNRVSNSLIEQIDALTKIANEFSNFAKMPAPQIEKVDLVALIASVVHLFENTPNVEIQYSGLDELEIDGDKDQLLRVINNLVKNSIQAIHHADGLIEIRTVLARRKVQITVSDNGSGIPTEQIDKMFVPYFTTKNTGSGLGLSMVKQIIENHGGEISFTTEKDKGTVFTLLLPA